MGLPITHFPFYLSVFRGYGIPGSSHKLQELEQQIQLMPHLLVEHTSYLFWCAWSNKPPMNNPVPKGEITAANPPKNDSVATPE